jgi:RNA polymerase subunit RPABC4/transcription elongation factor Spt4
MFFLIGGIQPRTVRVEKQPQACPYCSRFNVYRKRVDHYLALFFIPILRVKKGVPFLACDDCNTLLETMDSGAGFERPDDTGIQECRYCGKSFDADFSYCPYCGKRC